MRLLHKIVIFAFLLLIFFSAVFSAILLQNTHIPLFLVLVCLVSAAVIALIYRRALLATLSEAYRNAPSISSALNSLDQDCQRLNHQVYLTTQYMQPLIFEKLFYGKMLFHEQYAELLEMGGISIPPTPYVVVIFDVNFLDSADFGGAPPPTKTDPADIGWGYKDFKNVGASISSVLDDILSPRFCIHNVNLTDGFTCMVSFPDTGDDHASSIPLLMDTLQTALDTLEQVLGFRLYAGISSAYTSLENVHLAYQEAYNLYVHFLYDTNAPRIIFYPEFVDKHPASIPAKEDVILAAQDRQYISFIAQFQFDKAEQILMAEVKSLWTCFPPAPDLLKTHIQTRLKLAISVLTFPADILNSSIFFNNPTGSSLRASALNRLTAIGSLETLQENIHKAFDILRAYCQVNTLQSTDTVEAVRQYILANLQDPGMCIDTLCQNFQISNSLLSRRFHQKTGTKLIDFIHISRINHAKQLLFSSDMEINEIAVNSGYYDGPSFSRVFKRYTGLAPRDYRTASRQQELPF